MNLTQSAKGFIVLGAMALCFNASAQLAEMARVVSPQFESESAKLRAKPARQYEFSKALLGDVIRFLATDSGISYFSLPDGSPEGERLITFSLSASPFQALETLCKANGLALIIDGGIWYVRPSDDRELIGKPYEIKNNAFEHVSKSSSGGGESGGASSGQSSNSSTNGGSGYNNASSGTAQAGGVDLQGAQEKFKQGKSELINDIRAILDLPLESGDSVSGGGYSSPSLTSTGGGEGSGGGAPTDVYGNVRKAKILWKSDSNTLYVVATRLQHMWVEGYLAAADKPQALIALEVKFFETSRDPSSDFGVDWTGVFGDKGYGANTKIKSPSSTDTLTSSSSSASSRTGSIPSTDPNYSATAVSDSWNSATAKTLNSAARSFLTPTQAVLSVQDVNLKLRALLTDSQTKTVSYPRMVTTNNREVVLRSVINQPVLGGSASSSLSGGSTTTSAVSYLPIGTVINILPKKMREDKISMNIAITVSSIIGTTVIQGNPYPVASSRVYGAPVEVDSGYTVAIGGLDEAKEQEIDQGIPVLNKIPILGYLFKTHTKEKNHKNLMIFITPTLVDSKGGGLPDAPQAVLPRKPDALMPKVPRIAADGGLTGGIDALPNAVAFMGRASNEIGQVISENRGTKDDWEKINDLKASVRRLDGITERYMAQYPQRLEELRGYKWQLGKIKDDVSRARLSLVKKGYY